MLAHVDTFEAYCKHIENGEDLEWEQQPAVTPFAYGLAEAQVEQRTVKEHGVRAVTRWEAVVVVNALDANMIHRGGTRTSYVIAELIALLTSPFHISRPRVVAFIEGLKQSPYVEIVFIDQARDEHGNH